MIDIKTMIKDLLKDSEFIYIGNTTTPIEDGSTKREIKIDFDYVYVDEGNIVYHNNCKYIWFAGCWHDISEFRQLIKDDEINKDYINDIPIVKKMRHNFKEYPILVEQNNTLYMLQTFRPTGSNESMFFYVDIGDAIKNFINHTTIS